MSQRETKRAVCPVCQRDISVIASTGKIRLHKAEGTLQKNRCPCPGSSTEPKTIFTGPKRVRRKATDPWHPYTDPFDYGRKKDQQRGGDETS